MRGETKRNHNPRSVNLIQSMEKDSRNKRVLKQTKGKGKVIAKSGGSSSSEEMGSSAERMGRQTHQKQRKSGQRKVYVAKKQQAVVGELMKQIADLQGNLDGKREAEKAAEEEKREKEEEAKEEERLDVIYDFTSGKNYFEWEDEGEIEYRYLAVMAFLLVCYYNALFTYCGDMFLVVFCIVLGGVFAYMFTQYIDPILCSRREKVSWSDSVVTHRIQYNPNTFNPQSIDLRPDSLALGKLRHKDSLKTHATYTQMCSNKYLMKKIDLVVSLELFSQITTGSNARVAADNQGMYERLRVAAETTQSVNLNRYAALAGEAIVQDTVLMAYAYFRDMGDRLEGFPVPGVPSQ